MAFQTNPKLLLFLTLHGVEQPYKRVVKHITLPQHHCNPRVSTLLSTSVFFLILAFTTYSNAVCHNIKISNTFSTDDENQCQELMRSASHQSSEHQDSSCGQQVKPHDPRCDGIRRLLMDEKTPKMELPPPQKHGKKPKLSHWPKCKPRFPCIRRWS